MTTSKDFVTHIEAMAAQKFIGVGYRKRTAGIFTRAITDEVLGWVGLNKATRKRGPGAFEINPVVGVRHQTLERLVAELQGMKAHQYIPPSIGTNIGYLMPARRYIPFRFEQGHPGNDAAVAEMVATVEKFGRPFMRDNSDLSHLYDTMRTSGLGIPPQLEDRLPVVCALLGKKDQAEALLNEKLSQIGAQTGPAAEFYRRFATALRKRLAAGDLLNSAPGRR